MQPHTLRWINDTQFVEADATQMRRFDQEGALLGRLDQGAKLLACHPVSQAVRYLAYPGETGRSFTFRDWHWQTGRVEDLDLGSMWTYGCAFDAKGNFAECGDWEDGGYWRGIAHTGQSIKGASSMPILCSLTFSPDGSRLLLGGRWHYLAIWTFSPAGWQAEKTFEVQGGALNAVAWSDSGTYIAALNLNRRLLVWDVQMDVTVADMPAEVNYQLPSHHVRFVPGAEHLIWVSTEVCTQLINWRRQVVVYTLYDCETFALSPSGALVAYRRRMDEVPVVIPVEELVGDKDIQSW